MRGIGLFNNLVGLENGAVAPVPDKPVRRGRNEELMLAHYRKMIARLYFYRNFTRWSYDAVLDEIAAEFDLSRVTCMKVFELGSSREYMKVLMQLKPDKRWFKTEFRYMNWDVI